MKRKAFQTGSMKKSIGSQCLQRLMPRGIKGFWHCGLSGKAKHFCLSRLSPWRKGPKPFMSILDGCLIHLLRNALTHGISEDKKDGQTILFIQMKEKLGFRCQIMGDGIDPEKIKEKLSRESNLGIDQINSLNKADLLNKVFEAGFSTAQKQDQNAGFGMGLSAVREMVLQHDGKIMIDSDFDQGTKIDLEFPLEKISGQFFDDLNPILITHTKVFESKVNFYKSLN